jgi:hypothetical protein
MIGVELRVEGADVVPEGGVFYGNGAVGFYGPGELVELFDRDLLAVCGGFDLLNVTAEIADLVKGVPRGHLEFELVVNAGDFHGDVEKVLFRIGEGDFVADGGGGGGGEEQEEKKEKW